MTTSFNDILAAPKSYRKSAVANAALVASTTANGELDLKALRENLTRLAYARVETDTTDKNLAPHSKEFKQQVQNWQDQYNRAVRESLGLTKSTTVAEGAISLFTSLAEASPHGLTCNNPKQVNMSGLHNTLAGSSITCSKALTKVASR